MVTRVWHTHRKSWSRNAITLRSCRLLSLQRRLRSVILSTGPTDAQGAATGAETSSKPILDSAVKRPPPTVSSTLARRPRSRSHLRPPMCVLHALRNSTTRSLSLPASLRIRRCGGHEWDWCTHRWVVAIIGTRSEGWWWHEGHRQGHSWEGKERKVVAREWRWVWRVGTQRRVLVSWRALKPPGCQKAPCWAQGKEDVRPQEEPSQSAQVIGLCHSRKSMLTYLPLAASVSTRTAYTLWQPGVQRSAELWRTRLPSYIDPPNSIDINRRATVWGGESVRPQTISALFMKKPNPVQSRPVPTSISGAPSPPIPRVFAPMSPIASITPAHLSQATCSLLPPPRPPLWLWGRYGVWPLDREHPAQHYLVWRNNNFEIASVNGRH